MVNNRQSFSPPAKVACYFGVLAVKYNDLTCRNTIQNFHHLKFDTCISVMISFIATWY